MKILVIEDDNRIAEFLIRGLRAEGHVLQLATDGDAGFHAARTDDHDAIILDLMLPGMDGREICQNLRVAGIRTKILMLTALEATEDVVRGLRMGADDYLTKPFAFDELVARLEVFGRALQTGGDAVGAAQVLSAGDLRFDTESLTVTYAGARIELTSLEYALLEFLMSESGRVVSRARILQNVWGAHQDPLTNIVDVYVGRLRAKLAAQGGTDIIKTIRGRGYRLDG
ncbi:response regulator transcription factor [Actibacterium ureilyticum]|uniref:response regulator transcription factor n=1 Tax=Actibacterium ureilyticum TaxID=1590614 RepID=UPI000BAAD80F|nr:response regulator transcription factor [Actibacterium ureilyticum]